MKKWLNVRLYVDALRQLKLIGWMAFIVYMLEAVLLPLSLVIEHWESGTFPEETAIGMHPLLVTSFWVVIPLMMLYLFGFLNKRNAVDFYHAIPDRRFCVFFSMLAAVLTWGVFLVVSSFAVAILFRLCFGYLFLSSLDFGGIALYICTVLAGCIFMSGILAVSMCLTGTGFTNIAVAGMLLFVPRTLVTIVSDTLYNIFPFVLDTGESFVTNWSYNIPLGLFAMVFVGSGRNDVWGEWPSILYTGIVGILLITAAAFFFQVRKSESAGRSALNRPLQATFRLLLPSLISISTTTMLFAEIKENPTSNHGLNFLFGFIVFYVIAVVVYLLYELVTTRKWRNVLRSIPGLVLLVAINLAALLGIHTEYQRELNFRPSAGDITQVEYQTYSYSARYFDYCMNRVALHNPELCDALADAISEQTAVWERSPSEYRRNYLNHTVNFILTDRRGGVWGRMIDVDGATAELLSQSIYDEETLQNRLRCLPNAVSVFIENNKNDAVAFKLYDILREELAAMDFEKIYDIHQNPYDRESVVAMHVEVRVDDGSIRSMYFTLTPDHFPKTLNAYFELNASDFRKNQTEVVDILQRTLDPETEYIAFGVTAYDTDGSRIHLSTLENWCDASTKNFEEQRALLLECIRDEVGYMPTAGGRLLWVNIEYGLKKSDKDYYVSDQFGGGNNAFFVFREEAFQKLVANKTGGNESL